MLQVVLEVNLHYFDGSLILCDLHPSSRVPRVRWKRPWKCTKEAGHQAYLPLNVEPLQAGATPLGVGPFGTDQRFSGTRFVTPEVLILNQQDVEWTHTRETSIIGIYDREFTGRQVRPCK